MNKNINWNSIAAPLDIRNVYAPRNFIRKWNNFNRTETGVHFLCELANGNPIDYYVDVIQDDIIRSQDESQWFEDRILRYAC